ncbi:hypothetical protein HK107_11695 [Parvularcula sp. ZS-1/3]|uniref:Phage tail protein n=1 Tax=Parvularcula mediterranea TaxID=2732508 RepID=A0A7Y3RMU7_9PROT|nr:hypothetical protein [Parvularcula mediterranea]
MSAQAADLALLSVGEGTEQVPVAGLTRRSLRLDRRPGDRTTRDGAGWQEAEALTGPASAELRGEGVFLSGTAMDFIRTVFLEGESEVFALASGGGEWRGRFLVRQLSFDGKAEDEMRFSIRLTSTGPVAFSPSN